MHEDPLNGPVYALDDDHPAKKFLTAFYDCFNDCTGREIDFGGGKPIDQEWQSATDGKTWKFSAFAYMYLAFNVELDGFLQSAPVLTESEIAEAKELPRLKSLMHECADAAKRSSNSEVLELADRVLAMFDLWEQYLDYRREVIAGTRPS